MLKFQQLVLDHEYLKQICVTQKALDNTTVYGVDLPRHVYETLWGHADIFACAIGDYLVAEPSLFLQLNALGARSLAEGNQLSGGDYPHTGAYNALAFGEVFMHNCNLTDPELLKRAARYEKIEVKQGYTRCTTVALSDSVLLTSDRGVEKELSRKGMTAHYIDGSTIRLKSQSHGFIGGTCGLDAMGQLWFYGSLRWHPFQEQIQSICQELGVGIVEMTDAPLEDIGGLLFWKTEVAEGL